MNAAPVKAVKSVRRRPRIADVGMDYLRLFNPDGESTPTTDPVVPADGEVAAWGLPSGSLKLFTVHLWTAEEWAGLKIRPVDAAPCRGGFIALRSPSTALERRA